MKKETAAKYQLQNYLDLAKPLNQKQRIIFGGDKTFFVRPDGLKKMASHYGFKVPSSLTKTLGHSAVYGALRRGQITVGMGFATDPQIKQFDLIVLEDTQHFFPVYNPAPNLREEISNKYPRIAELANRLGPLLDNQTMIQLNYQVDIEKQSVAQVAQNWLKKVGLLP